MSTRRAALVLGSLEIFAPISMDLYMPALPELAQDLDTGDSLAQATMSACMIGLGAGQLIAGPLSDRIGRRRPMIIGIAAFVVLSICCALAPNIEVLLAARFLQGVAGSAGIVVTFAVARDLFDGIPLARLLSLLALVGALAPILAPVAGGQLAAIMDWRGIFLVLAGLGGALLLLAVTSLRETLPASSRHRGGAQTTTRQFGIVLADRTFVSLLIVAACGGIAFFTYLASISFVVQVELGMSPQMFSLIFAVNSIMTVTGSQLNRLALRWTTLQRMYLLGLTCGAGGSLLLLGVVLAGLPPIMLLGSVALLLCCYGITQPNGAALTLTRHGDRAGTAAALFGTSNFVIGPLVAPLASIGGASSLTMSVTMAAGSCLAALLAWRLVVPLLRAADQPPTAAGNDGTAGAETVAAETAGAEGAVEATGTANPGAVEAIGTAEPGAVEATGAAETGETAEPAEPADVEPPSPSAG